MRDSQKELRGATDLKTGTLRKISSWSLKHLVGRVCLPGKQLPVVRMGNTSICTAPSGWATHLPLGLCRFHSPFAQRVAWKRCWVLKADGEIGHVFFLQQLDACERKKLSSYKNNTISPLYFPPLTHGCSRCPVIYSVPDQLIFPCFSIFHTAAPVPGTPNRAHCPLFLSKFCSVKMFVFLLWYEPPHPAVCLPTDSLWHRFLFFIPPATFQPVSSTE